MKADTKDIRHGVAMDEDGRIDTNEVGPRAQLLAMIIDNYNTAELKHLAFNLGVFYDHLGGDTLPVKSQSLVEFCERNGRMYMLVSECQKKRPDLEWPSL